MIYTISDNTISMFLDGRMKTVDDSHQNFPAILEALNEGVEDEETYLGLFDPKQTLNQYQFENIRIEGDDVLLDDVPIHTSFAKEIVRYHLKGYPVKSMLAGLRRLHQNPSFRVREELHRFMQRGNLPWREDGKFLAFKRVRDNYTDVHTGTFSNHIGAVVEMSRRDVDDDMNQTCSAGFHVCSEGYLNSFSGDRIVVCAVDPVDVVAIPYDYNDCKMRVCKYEVVSEILEEAVPQHEEDYYGDYDVDNDYDNTYVSF